MSSCIMNHPDSDEEVDLEALRLAALKSRKPKYPRVNHHNLIPIVPVTLDSPEFINKKIKTERVSPAREDENKEEKEEKASNYSEETIGNDQDILSMDDKEEEDSLERLMDQLEAEISGKAPLPTTVTKIKTSKKTNKNDDGEIELVQVKTGKEPGAIIEIRESASPEILRKSHSPKKRSRSRLRSRSPFFRSYKRSRSPYWSRSPRRSRSPFRRSRSPYWRRSRSISRKSRSPIRRYRSPGRKRSPLLRFSRTRSRSFDRRRSPWSVSPRRRSKSPFYGLSRRRNSPRRSLTPRGGTTSPWRRSRSPRRFGKNSPLRRSKSPFFRRSRTPVRRFTPRRSKSPFRTKSPLGKHNSPAKFSKRLSKSPIRRSPERASSKPRSPRLSPRKSPGRLNTKGNRIFSLSTSPNSRRNRSPLRVVEKNKIEGDKRDRNRNEKRHRSLSRENKRGLRYRNRRYSPNRRGSADKSIKRSKSPKLKESSDGKELTKTNLKEKMGSIPAPPSNSILEARKKKFENLNEIDPTIDKKISLKSIKESTENVEEDEDALTINVEGNLWDESEESEDDFESRFKSSDAKKVGMGNKTVLSFRNLQEGGSRKINLNKPLTDDNRKDRNDRWSRNDRRKKHFEGDKSRNGDKKSRNERTTRPDRKPIVWSNKNERKVVSKDNEVSTTHSEDKNKSDRRTRDKGNDSCLPESDDFDKLISDFEKELESDCLSTKEVETLDKRPKISVKKDLFEPKMVEPVCRPPREVRISEESAEKLEKDLKFEKIMEEDKIELEEPEIIDDGPEDYVEDDDFVFEESPKRKHGGKEEEEDSQSDLRAVLSRRRNERLTKAVSLQENMPTRLVQSAFQGLGNKKSKRSGKEPQETVELTVFDRNMKNSGTEGRRVLLLQREKNPLIPSVKCTVPEVKPDTTIYQRFGRSSERRKRKLQRQLEPAEDLLDQEEEDEGFDLEEEKQGRRFRLKRNVTLSSQVQN